MTATHNGLCRGYQIRLDSCHASTEIGILLTEDEAAALRTIAHAVTAAALGICQPRMRLITAGAP